MVLATYQLSSAVEPRQFMDSELCGEGRAYNNVIMFSAGRKGEFRVSLMDYWGVMYFHQCFSASRSMWSSVKVERSRIATRVSPESALIIISFCI